MRQVDVSKLAYDPLMSFADANLTGLHRLQIPLGIQRNTEAAMRADVDVVRQRYAEHHAAMSQGAEAVAAKKAVAAQVNDYIRKASSVLKSVLGGRYSQAWGEAGFTNATLQVKPALDVRQNLLTSLAAYFTAHPAQQLADWGVTATEAMRLHATSVACVDAVNAARVVQRQAKTLRDAALDVLRTRIRHLFQELKQILPDNDSRWIDFGFNVPGDVTTPDAPENVTVEAGAAGEATLRWEKPANTERFHVWQEVVGADAVPVRIQTVKNTTIKLTDLPHAAHLKWFITAVNPAGESVRSEAVDLVVPKSPLADPS